MPARSIVLKQNRIDSKHISAIMFDLDGVLVDSYQIWYQLFNRALAHFGFPVINDSKFLRHWGQSTEDDVRIFMKGKTVQEVRAYFLEHFKEYINYLKVNPSANTILRYFKKQKLKLGCVTNSHRHITQLILTYSKMSQFFNTIVTADDVEHPKPAPDMLLKACAALKTDPSQTVFIGDTKTDIMAGKNAGCIVIGYNVISDLTINDLIELRQLFTTLF